MVQSHRFFGIISHSHSSNSCYSHKLKNKHTSEKQNTKTIFEHKLKYSGFRAQLTVRMNVARSNAIRDSYSNRDTRLVNARRRYTMLADRSEPTIRARYNNRPPARGAAPPPRAGTTCDKDAPT